MPRQALPPALERLLDAYPPAVRTLALRARALLLRKHPDLTEKVWTGWKMIGYGHGPKMSDFVVGLGPAKAHLGVHLAGGIHLDDPAKLLEGTSKSARHVRITSVDELESPEVARLVDGAFALARAKRDAAPAPARQPAKRVTAGGYQVGGSKTIVVPLDALWHAWTDTRTRRMWLPDTFTVRKATEPKSLRITWHDGTDLQVLFYAKGDAKSQVTIDHRKLPQSRVEEMKAYWQERLALLKEQLEQRARQVRRTGSTGVTATAR